MTLINNGSQSYNYTSCQQFAQQNNYSYFGLQNSTSGEDAQCVVSNDLNQSTRYGLANNCTTLSNGIVSGGGLSNAVYSTLSQGTYYLILQDDGNMCIYRGSGPNNNQGVIWCSRTNGKMQEANPAYAAAKGKYGQNWIVSGSTLAPGDFIGTESGSMYLLMQSDGNLVLYTSSMKENCSADQNNNMGGGQNANALYMLDSAVGNPQTMGKVAYIDSDANLREYPSSMIGKSNTYTKYSNFDSYGNDLISMANTSLENCQSSCNENNDCNGFVYLPNNQLCFLKDDNMYPKSGKQQVQGLDLYTRTPQLMNNTLCPQELINIDSIQYDNYVKGDDMTPEDNCDAILVSDKEQKELNKLSSQLANISNNVEQKIQKLYKNNTTINKQMDKGAKTMNTDFRTYYDVKQKTNTLLEQNMGKKDKENIQKIKNNNMLGGPMLKPMLEPMLNMNDLNAMINDTDLVVLQNNYQYIMWSIVAVGLVAVTINTIKK
jgi:hypothetical protein